jgi:lipoate-protein ligase A
MKGEVGKLVDFRRFIEPVIHFLSTLGIEALMGPRNEILVGGKKVSGNAEHVHKNRVLHHGTLLFKADLSMLRESIRIIPGRYVDKAVQSNRSKVTNLADHLPGIPDLDAFGKLFLQYMLDRFKGEIYHPAEETMMAVLELSKLKYNSWEWIYGWSPDYEFQGDAVCPAGILHVHLKVHRGVIISCSLQSSQISGDHLRSLENCITGCRHEADHLENLLRNWKYVGCENENCLKDLLFGFF